MGRHRANSEQIIPDTADRHQLRQLSEVVKFTALAAMLAIFFDAAIGHAMICGNDPYWTYWVTDTLLMATVFGLGTMWLGIGLGRGALITGVHVTLLTIYYWTLSPIGLPSHAEWLDLEHTWVTGLPVHLAVYYLGYVTALWLWNRRAAAKRHQQQSQSSLLRAGVAVLAATAAIVVITGIVQTIAFQEFPGVTWFIVRIAVAFPFSIAWWMMAGTDRAAALGGGIALGLLLTTYSHFLSPTGLPSGPIRLLASDSPPAVVHWLTYRQEFLVMLPITALVATLAYLIVARRHETGVKEASTPAARLPVLGVGGAGAFLAILGIAAAPYLGPDAHRVSLDSAGMANIERNTGDGIVLERASAKLRLTLQNRNTHRTPLAPHDTIDLVANVRGADGAVYDIRSTRPLVADPQGRFTTWQGVAFGKWHGGRSGIGLSELPPIYSNVLAFALASIRAEGLLIASEVPVQVMATRGDARQLLLQVGDPLERSAGIPNGSFRVAWRDFTGGHSSASKYARYAFGGAFLFVLLAGAWGMARRELDPNGQMGSRSNATGIGRGH